MDPFDLLVVGGGIGGGAAALRAAQYHMHVAWILGDRQTARRSRASWVGNVDNIQGLHDGIVKGKILKALRGEDFAAARAAIEGKGHIHIGTRDIVENTRQRLEEGYSDFVEFVPAAASAARRGEGGFEVVAGDRELCAPSLLLATGIMDEQPRIRKATGEEVIEDPRWIYPYANHETVLYCIRCDGHLTAGTCAGVIGHGPGAAGVACMLHERYGSGCAVLTHGVEPSWDAEMDRLLAAYGIEVHRAAITGAAGEKGRLHGFELADGSSVRLDFALVVLGLHRVYNDLARQLGAGLLDDGQPPERQHVLIDHRGETTVHGLFAVGDMARRSDEPVMHQIYTAQEYAVRAVDTVDSRRRREMRRRALEAAG